MRCIVHCISSYPVSVEDMRGIMVTVANTIFNQEWELQGDLETKTQTTDSDTSSNADSDSDVEQEPLIGPPHKKLRVSTELSNVFPSRRTINRCGNFS